MLRQLLYSPRITLRAVFPERISRPPFSVFSEIVCGELFRLAEEIWEGDDLDALGDCEEIVHDDWELSDLDSEDEEDMAT
jgi:hypothetical protein